MPGIPDGGCGGGVAMTSYQAITVKTYRELLSKMGTALRAINPREGIKPGGQHGELEIQTDGYDEALTSGERCVAYKIAATLKLYQMWPEGKGAGC